MPKQEHHAEHDAKKTMEEFAFQIEQCKEALPIDQYSLDRECSKQSTLYQEASELCANIKFLLKESSLELDNLQAEHSLALRVDPKEYGFGENQKLTEALITNVIIDQVDVQLLKKAIEKLQYYANIAQGLVIAYDHKRSMLNNHVDLMRMDSLGYGTGNREETVDATPQGGDAQVQAAKTAERKKFRSDLKRNKMRRKETE